MSARVLSGKELAASVRAEAAERATALAAAGRPPKLAVVVANADESSAWYVRSIARAAEKAGIACDIVGLGAEADPGRIRDRLAEMSADDTVHGVILQPPLPRGA